MSLRHLIPLSLVICLTACATATPTASPQPTTSRATNPSPTLPSEASPFTPTPPSPEPSATPATKTQIVFITASGTASEDTLATLRRAGQDFGWEGQLVEDPTQASLETATQAGAAIIVINDSALAQAAVSLAPQYPQTYFIALQAVQGDVPTNMVVLSQWRSDQTAFLAGMMAGFKTQNKYVVSMANSATVSGLMQANGFLHGARYVCPKCRIETIPLTSDSTQDAQQVVIYANSGADVFFTATDAPASLILKAAETGAWVIGSGGDVYVTTFENGARPGADKLLTSVYLDPGAALYAALATYQAGAPLAGQQTLSATNGSIIIAPYRVSEETFSALDKQDVETALTRLADDSLDTGIDPVTGEEK